MIDGEKTRMRFAWTGVDSRLVRELVGAAYEGYPHDLAALRTDADWCRQATRVFGETGTRLKDQDPALGVLRSSWLEKRGGARPDDLIHIAALVSRRRPGLGVQPGANTSELRGYLAARRMSPTFRLALAKRFVFAHRVPMAVLPKSRRKTSVGPTSAPKILRGQDLPSLLDLRDYQQQAHEGFDKLLRARTSEGRRGLLILPTGAGKTLTAVSWLVRRMAKQADLRVLWVSHQQELLQQALGAFESEASVQAASFERRLRLITSGHSQVSSLASDDLDVALITWQSLNAGWEERNRGRLKRFLQERPTVVIVDEAHHAGAPAYQRQLGVVANANAVLIGLTATPWPTAAAARQRLRATFPVLLKSISQEELHARGVLATPILHTVDSGMQIHLTRTEVQQARADLPPSVLRQFDRETRDRLVVDLWMSRHNDWGKTLLFATSTLHADHLGDALVGRGADVRVLHSAALEPREEILTWFRQHPGPCVLVSVGMLTEGVDLPDARTAFLARPTTSRILMRQMIGRVLRGPGAGGEREAHLVYIRDQWQNFEDVVDPIEMSDIPQSLALTTPGRERVLPSITTDDGQLIGEDLLAQIRRMYQNRPDRIPIDPATTTTRLAGYYVTDHGNVPVMDHQLDGYKALLAHALSGRGFQGSPPRSFFQDDHPPYPTQRAVDAVLGQARHDPAAPEFVNLVATLSPNTVAALLRDRAAMTDTARQALMRSEYETSLARVAYPTFDHFEEAVERELRELRRAAIHQAPRLNAERLEETLGTSRGSLPRRPSRAVPDLHRVLAMMREVLQGEPAADRLPDRTDLAVKWTDRPIKSMWAYWSLRPSGKGAGAPIIRINRVLQAPTNRVSEEALNYLLFHEVLHDLLPGQGHDAEFRRLEALWPDADLHDRFFDELHEHYDLAPARR